MYSPAKAAKNLPDEQLLDCINNFDRRATRKAGEEEADAVIIEVGTKSGATERVRVTLPVLQDEAKRRQKLTS